MKILKTFGVVALAAGMLQSATAYSTVVGTLVFTDPTGTVNADDTIEVRVRLTLDGSSDALTYNASDSYPSGVNPADIPLDGYNFDLMEDVPFDTYDYVSQFFGRSCDDTFTVGCSSPGSQYSYSASGLSNSWFDFSGTINPGESLEFNLYKLTPVAGVATPGTYELFTANLGLLVYGTDLDGNEMNADIYRFATNCPDANCTFTRTVSAVPVPAAVWLFGSALLGLGALKRRKA